MSAIMQRLLLFFAVIACCVPADAQLACCQLQEPGNITALPVNSNPVSVAISPVNNCLAVANFTASSISVFTIDPNDCSLTPVTEFDLPPGSAPGSVAFSPDGACLAVANFGTSNISVFSVGDPNPCSVNPTPVSSIDLPPGSAPGSVAFSPDGACLAVANFGTSNISVFSVGDPTPCSVNPIPVSSVGLPAGSGPASVAFSPNGNCLAVANQDTSNISVFSVGDPTPCSVNPIPVSSIDLPAGSNPIPVAFSPDGACLAVANFGTSNISVFSVGDPTPCSVNPISVSSVDLPAGSNPTSIAFSRITNCLAVANRNTNDITVFSVAIAQQPTIASATVPDCTTIVTVTGTSSANATITLFVDGISNAMGTTGTDGSFSIDTTPLSAGTHSITAIATVSGCTSTPSDGAIVTIGSPTITSASVGCGNFVTVVGTGVPNSMVSIAVDDVTIATVTTNSEGTFVFAGIQFSSGMHCITATDTASGCASAPVCINVSPLSCVLGGPNLAFGTHCNR